MPAAIMIYSMSNKRLWRDEKHQQMFDQFGAKEGG